WNICRARRGLAAEITFGEQDLYLFQRLWHELDPCPPIRYRLPSKVQATIRRDAEGQAHMHLWIDQPLDLGKRFALIKQVFQGIFPPLGDILLEEDTFTAIASLLNEGPTPR
ncbi:MAG: hypothetical protein NZ482_10335, partial [Gloeomargarita sp. SKYG98]|nr:hypothetical protein [Gloeomargarita sp. SKYG98]